MFAPKSLLWKQTAGHFNKFNVIITPLHPTAFFGNYLMSHRHRVAGVLAKED